MENRIQHFLLVTTLCFASNVALAAEQTEPSDEKDSEQIPEQTQVWDEASTIAEPTIARNKVDVSAIDAYDIEIGLFAGQMNVEDFGTNPLVGFSLGFHVTENIFTQLTYGTTDTEPSSFEIISGSNLMTDDERTYTYYDLNLGYNLLPGESFFSDETTYNSTFYTTLGIGSTDFAGDQRFTYNLAFGYKLLLTDWMAVNLEVKDSIFDIDILGTDKTTHNISYNLGVSMFF